MMGALTVNGFLTSKNGASITGGTSIRGNTSISGSTINLTGATGINLNGNVKINSQSVRTDFGMTERSMGTMWATGSTMSSISGTTLSVATSESLITKLTLGKSLPTTNNAYFGCFNLSAVTSQYIIVGYQSTSGLTTSTSIMSYKFVFRNRAGDLTSTNIMVSPKQRDIMLTWGTNGTTLIQVF